MTVARRKDMRERQERDVGIVLNNMENTNSISLAGNDCLGLDPFRSRSDDDGRAQKEQGHGAWSQVRNDEQQDGARRKGRDRKARIANERKKEERKKA